MRYLDKLGWPVEMVKGRPILNFIRLLIHTRKVVRHWEPPAWISEPSNCCTSPTQPEGVSDE